MTVHFSKSSVLWHSLEGSVEHLPKFPTTIFSPPPSFPSYSARRPYQPTTNPPTHLPTLAKLLIPGSVFTTSFNRRLRGRISRQTPEGLRYSLYCLPVPLPPACCIHFLVYTIMGFIIIGLKYLKQDRHHTLKCFILPAVYFIRGLGNIRSKYPILDHTHNH